MTDQDLMLSIEKMLNMIGISETDYITKMKNKKKPTGVATPTNIDRIVHAIKNETMEHFGYEFQEIKNFDDKNIKNYLRKFMARQDEKPGDLKIGTVRRGRKRPRCKF